MIGIRIINPKGYISNSVKEKGNCHWDHFQPPNFQGVFHTLFNTECRLCQKLPQKEIRVTIPVTVTFGKFIKVILTILWLIIYAPIAFLVHLTIPHVNKLMKWIQAKEITTRQRIARFSLALPVMAVFLPLIFITSVGAKVLEDNFTKHL